MVQSETLNPRFPNIAAAFAFLIALLLLFATVGTAAWRMKLGDPDNYGRLIQVRDWLNGQSWWDVTQHRVNPPTGLDTHWSRIADVPIAALIELADLFTTRAVAEQIAVTLIPLIYLFLVMILIAHIAGRLSGGLAAIIAALMASVSIYTLSQFAPGRIDHHGLQMLLTIAAAACLIGRESFRNGIISALLTALSLGVGLESLPYLAAAGAWVAFRWAVRGAPTNAKTLGYAFGVALFTPVLLILTRRPDDWLVAHHDALSIAHVAVATIGCAALALAIKVASNESAKGRVLAILIAAFAAAIPMLYFRASFAAPYSEVEAGLRDLWLGNIAETRSFFETWEIGPIGAVGEILFPFLAMLAAVSLFHRSKGKKREAIALIGLLVFTGLILTLWQIRTRPLAYAFAIPVAAVAIVQARETWKQKGGSIIPFAVLAFVLNPVLPMAASKAAQSALQGPSSLAASAQVPDASCDDPALYDPLALLPPGLAVSPIDISNRILARSPHFVLSSPIHRNAAANGAAYQILLTPPQLARQKLRAMGARYVVFCATANETDNLVRHSPGGLLSQLQQGNVPEWLVSQPPRSTALKVFSLQPGGLMSPRSYKPRIIPEADA